MLLRKAATCSAAAQCKMDAFKGKYERTSADQYDEFMKVLGVGMLLRKAATCSTPVVEITESAGVWSIKSSTTLKTIELKFKLNEEFEESTPDGRQVKSLVPFEDGKIVCVQKAVKEGQKALSRSESWWGTSLCTR